MESLDENLNINEFLTLVSTDNQSFEIKKELCNLSDYLNGLMNLDTEYNKININLSSDLLKIIIDFLNFYPKNPFYKIQKPVPKNFQDSKFIYNDDTFTENFYTNLIHFNDNNTFIVFIRQVNYLGIKPLLELSCAKLANIIRDLSSEEEKKFLQIEE